MSQQLSLFQMADMFDLSDGLVVDFDTVWRALHGGMCLVLYCMHDWIPDFYFEHSFTGYGLFFFLKWESGSQPVVMASSVAFLYR